MPAEERANDLGPIFRLVDSFCFTSILPTISQIWSYRTLQKYCVNPSKRHMLVFLIGMYCKCYCRSGNFCCQYIFLDVAQ